MSIKEKLSRSSDRLKERIQDPEIQASFRRSERALGELTIRGALGEDGLDLIKEGKNGERKLKKVKTARVALRTVRNPIGVARRAGMGVAKEARDTLRSGGIEAAGSILESVRTREIADVAIDSTVHPKQSERHSLWGDSGSDTLPPLPDLGDSGSDTLPPLPDLGEAETNGTSTISDQPQQEGRLSRIRSAISRGGSNPEPPQTPPPSGDWFL